MKFLKKLKYAKSALVVTLLLGGTFSARAFDASLKADSSRLSQGRWVKIKVTDTGIHAITAADAQKWGMSDLSRVHVFGFGAQQIPGKLTQDIPDDLPQLPVVRLEDKILFYAQGPISWAPNSAMVNYAPAQHPYATEGYYFVTDDSRYTDEAITVASQPVTGTVVTTVQGRVFHEQELVNPGETGNVMLGEDFSNNKTQTYNFALDGYVDGGNVNVLTSFAASTSTGRNDGQVNKLTYKYNGTNLPFNPIYDRIFQVTNNAVQHYNLANSYKTFTLSGTRDLAYEVTLSSVGTVYLARLNFIAVNYDRHLALSNGKIDFGQYRSTGSVQYQIAGCSATTHVWDVTNPSSPVAMNVDLQGNVAAFSPIATGNREYIAFEESGVTYPSPVMVHEVAAQNIHGEPTPDMIIISPKEYLTQAQRIADMHTTIDSMRVLVLDQNVVFNEFSSGTPDATAYRRYLKMLYDRAETEADMPRYLLLFGDGAWDNRMLISDWRNCNPDDFLLCYESDNSFSEVKCYVSDDYYCLLDDEEEIQQRTSRETLNYLGKPDVAVGRFPVRSAEEAKIIVDKTIGYANNENAGSWQNTLMFMGDDGNNNAHMITADKVANALQAAHPALNIKKVFWDAYARQSSSTGNTYPDAAALIKSQMAEGALMMNYSGHGISYGISHEFVLRLADFEEPTSLRLPLWLTASCDIMAFDGQEENIGEAAVLNKKGGAIAFFGTTRTVYANYNELINLGFSQYVLGSTNGVRNTIGEAARMIKCDLVDSRRDVTPNKLQYTLLGDPALVLAAPTQKVVIDQINGLPIDGAQPVRLAAGSIAKVTGHIASGEALDATFNGTITAIVRDAEETIVCRLNDPSDADEAFVFNDRTKTLYIGSDSIRSGAFTFTFAVPKDISYTDGTGLMTLYAVNHEKTRTAHGVSSNFILNGSSTALNDSIGPSIYCYLNSKSFRSGGKVHTSPYFVAELYDDNGINASGSSIGHDLELIIDGDMAKTYNLNSCFAYEFGDYRSGTLGFSIPALDYGHHHLLFRAWDVLNNSSTAELDFLVARDIAPECIGVRCLRDPATGGATFVITHDRAGSELHVQLDIYDMAGRQLWRYTETGVPADNTYTFDWNLSMDGGRRLQTGVYLFKISISSDGSGQSSMTKKLLITNTN